MHTTLRYSTYAALLLGSTSIALADGGGRSDVVGSFTVGGGLASFESTDFVDVNDLILNGSASVGGRLGKDWTFQLDVAAEQVALHHGGEGGEGNQYLSAQAIGGHVTWHKQGTGSIGIFAAFGAATDANPYDSSDGENPQSGPLVGLEGMLRFNEITLYAQAAALDISDHEEDEGLNSSAYFVRLMARYFLNDNQMIEGELARIDSDDFDGCCGSPGDTVEGTEWALKFQGRLEGSLYGSVGYRGGNYEENLHDEADLDQFIVSLTFLMGPDSLRANDQNGVNLETPMMPFRGAGVLEAID